MQVSKTKINFLSKLLNRMQNNILPLVWIQFVWKDAKEKGFWRNSALKREGDPKI